MKTKFALLSLLLTGVFPVSAQGTFTFNNNTATAITNAMTGLRASSLTVAAYYGADTNAVTGQNSAGLLLLPTAITNLATPGFFFGGTRQVPSASPGSYIAMQIRAWSGAYPSYEAALQGAAVGSDFNVVFGTSRVFVVGPLAGGPNPIPSITGPDQLNAFLVGVPVPEPSAYALGLIGAACLYFCRRFRRC